MSKAKAKDRRAQVEHAIRRVRGQLAEYQKKKENWEKNKRRGHEPSHRLAPGPILKPKAI